MIGAQATALEVTMTSEVIQPSVQKAPGGKKFEGRRTVARKRGVLGRLVAISRRCPKGGERKPREKRGGLMIDRFLGSLLTYERGGGEGQSAASHQKWSRF